MDTPSFVQTGFVSDEVEATWIEETWDPNEDNE
jgi:hypothetical protein